MTLLDAPELFLLVAIASYVWATMLGAFARSLDRLGAIRRRAFAEEHSRAARELLDRPGGDAPLRAAIGALRSSAFVLSSIVLARGVELLGVSRPLLATILLAVPGVAVTEIGLTVLVRRGRAIRILILLSPVVRLFVAPLLPLVDPFVEQVEPTGPATAGTESDEEPGESEVKAFLDLGGEEGILEEKEKRLVASMIDFGDSVVREVMTPRIDMTTIPAETPLDAAAARFAETKLSRIPLWRGGADQIAGIVHVQDLLAALVAPGSRPATVGAIARPALFVPETTRLGSLMAEFQSRSLQMAIVLDEYGGVSGLVTLEDLLEEIVGEIGDEHEAAGAEAIVEVEPGFWRLPARARIEELAQLQGGEGEASELESPDFDTVGGLLAARLGHIPAVGESVRVAGLELRVERADRQRVFEVTARRIGADERGAAAGSPEERS